MSEGLAIAAAAAFQRLTQDVQPVAPVVGQHGTRCRVGRTALRCDSHCWVDRPKHPTAWHFVVQAPTLASEATDSTPALCFGVPHTGKDLNKTTSLGPSTDCNMPCTGNDTQICGGALAMNVYELTDQYWNVPSKSHLLSARCKSHFN